MAFLSLGEYAGVVLELHYTWKCVPATISCCLGIPKTLGCHLLWQMSFL